MKAKYFDFTGTIVYSIVPDPVPNIYQTQPKILETWSVGKCSGFIPLEKAFPDIKRYNWYGLAEEDK